MPYHGRTFLAYLAPRGFVAPEAILAHPSMRFGRNVYVGDRVIATREKDGGEVHLQDEVHLYGDTFLMTGSRGAIRIGRGTHVQLGCRFHAFLADISIGAEVEVAPSCAIYSYNHSTVPDVPIMHQPLQTNGPVVIGDGAWLGHGAIILSGVHIGSGAVVAAGSVVVKNIPENAIAAGVPARVLKLRSSVPTQLTPTLL